MVQPVTTLAQSSDRQIYDLGTAPTRGVAHPLGVTIAALVKLKLLPEAKIDINARNTSGSRDNAIDLRDGDLDFAILTNLDAFDASRGNGPFADIGPDPDLRLLTNLWTSAYHFIIRREQASTGTFADFIEFQSRRVALGKIGSSVRNHASALLTAFGVDAGEAYDLVDLGGRDAADAFLAGDLDGFLLVDDRSGIDIRAFMERAGDQATVLTFERDDILAAERDGAPAWIQVTVPPGSFLGQNPNQLTIGTHNLLGTSTRIPDDVVYQITKTIYDDLPFLREMDRSTVGINLETALDRLLIPAHDGAATYYREVGVLVPEPEPLRISRLTESSFLTRFASAEEARSRLSESTVTVLGGEAGQTTTRMISELAASLDDTGIRVVGMTSPTGAENLADVLYARGVDSALVPFDILNYALAQNVYPDLSAKIAYAAEFFTEEVHLLAASNVREIDDLIGQPVNLGPRDSSSAFTASFLLDRLKLPVEPSYHDDRTALAMLERGELSALFMISGKPMPLLSALPSTTGLRLLSLPPIDDGAYRSATLSANDYPNLLSVGDRIDTFGVRTALLSYNWRDGNPRLDALSTFVDALFDRLPVLQDQSAGYHPKWREVYPLRDIGGLRRSPAAQRWIDGRDRQETGGSEPVNG